MTSMARSGKPGRAAISSLVTAWMTGIGEGGCTPTLRSEWLRGAEAVADRDSTPLSPVERREPASSRRVDVRYAPSAAAAADEHAAFVDVDDFPGRAARRLDWSRAEELHLVVVEGCECTRPRVIGANRSADFQRLRAPVDACHVALDLRRVGRL